MIRSKYISNQKKTIIAKNKIKTKVNTGASFYDTTQNFSIKRLFFY